MNEEQIQREKRRLIQRVQVALDAIPERIYQQNSFKIAQKLIKHAEFQRVPAVGIFVGFGGELDTIRLMEAALHLEKRVAAPTVDVAGRRLVWREIKDPGKDIDLGPLGIPQPLPSCREVDVSTLGLITIPGLVWDEQGHRLALWPGYFNRLMRALPRTFKVGLGFEVQVLEELSHIETEVLIDALITEDTIRRCGPEMRRESSGRIPGGPSGYKG
jgi:5-formyltetrahydrofolate cyclo-ligase